MSRQATEVKTQMSTQEAFVQQFAKLFVHYQEALSLSTDGPEDGELQSWQQAPQIERERMVAAAKLALIELETEDRGETPLWYARPGEAEWGC